MSSNVKDIIRERIRESLDIGLINIMKLLSDENVLSMFLTIQEHLSDDEKMIKKEEIRKVMELNDTDFETTSFKLIASGLITINYTDEGQYFRLEEFPSFMVESMIKCLRLSSAYEYIDDIKHDNIEIRLFKCECGYHFGVDKRYISDRDVAISVCPICKRCHIPEN